MATHHTPEKEVRHGPSLSRRAFLGSIGGATAMSVVGLPALLERKRASADEIGPTTGHERAKQAFRIRQQAALTQLKPPFPDHPNNGDEASLPYKIGNYSKGLPHNPLGEVALHAYDTLLHALSSGEPTDFENILLAGDRKLVNPQAGLAFELEGDDSHKFVLPPAPAFRSAEEAGEAVALSILRDQKATYNERFDGFTLTTFDGSTIII